MEIEELRTRNLGIEQRLESEKQNHRKALDQLREDRKSCQELFLFLSVSYLDMAKNLNAVTRIYFF